MSLLVTSSFLFLVVQLASLLLVAMPGAPSCFLFLVAMSFSFRSMSMPRAAAYMAATWTHFQSLLGPTQSWKAAWIENLNATERSAIDFHQAHVSPFQGWNQCLLIQEFGLFGPLLGGPCKWALCNQPGSANKRLGDTHHCWNIAFPITSTFKQLESFTACSASLTSVRHVRLQPDSSTSSEEARRSSVRTNKVNIVNDVFYHVSRREATPRCWDGIGFFSKSLQHS